MKFFFRKIRTLWHRKMTLRVRNLRFGRCNNLDQTCSKKFFNAFFVISGGVASFWKVFIKFRWHGQNATKMNYFWNIVYLDTPVFLVFITEIIRRTFEVRIDNPYLTSRSTRLKGPITYDIRCFLDILELRNYLSKSMANLILYSASLSRKIRCILTYLPKNLWKYFNVPLKGSLPIQYSNRIAQEYHKLSMS